MILDILKRKREQYTNEINLNIITENELKEVEAKAAAYKEQLLIDLKKYHEEKTNALAVKIRVIDELIQEEVEENNMI